MAKQFDALADQHIEFIRQQQMFFVATAGKDGLVNVSPKGLDSLRVVDSHTVTWMNLTGSGNESAAHVLENGRMTIMFCSFSDKPLILRLYGKARAIHPREEEWADHYAAYNEQPSARQIFVLDISMVQTSCGVGVPRFDLIDQRDTLSKWAEKRSPEQIQKYWQESNNESLDGKPTGII